MKADKEIGETKPALNAAYAVVLNSLQPPARHRNQTAKAFRKVLRSRIDFVDSKLFNMFCDCSYFDRDILSKEIKAYNNYLLRNTPGIIGGKMLAPRRKLGIRKTIIKNWIYRLYRVHTSRVRKMSKHKDQDQLHKPIPYRLFKRLHTRKTYLIK